MSIYTLTDTISFEDETLNEHEERLKRNLRYREAYLLLAHSVRKIVCRMEMENKEQYSKLVSELDNALAVSEICVLEGLQSKNRF